MSYWASWIIQQIQFFFVQLGGFHRVCVQHPDNVYPLVDPWQCLRCWNALCYVSCILKCSCDCQCLCTDVWSPTMSFLVFYPCTAIYECKAIVLQLIRPFTAASAWQIYSVQKSRPFKRTNTWKFPSCFLLFCHSRLAPLEYRHLPPNYQLPPPRVSGRPQAWQ